MRLLRQFAANAVRVQVSTAATGAAAVAAVRATGGRHPRGVDPIRPAGTLARTPRSDSKQPTAPNQSLARRGTLPGPAGCRGFDQASIHSSMRARQRRQPAASGFDAGNGSFDRHRPARPPLHFKACAGRSTGSWKRQAMRHLRHNRHNRHNRHSRNSATAAFVTVVPVVTVVSLLCTFLFPPSFLSFLFFRKQQSQQAQQAFL